MINRLFSNIYGNVGTNIQDTSSGMATIIKVYINDIYRDLLRRANWQSYNPDYQITTVAGTRDYVLPSNFGKEKYVYDSSNLRYIPFIDFDSISEKYPALVNTQGTVDRYTIFYRSVRTQPTSASTLSFSSSSSADTTQSVRIKGTDSNDIELEETITLNGMTPVPTVNTYKEIRSITKSATTTGRISGTSNAAAVVIAVLAPADLDYKVKIMRFNQTPGSVIVFNVPYHIEPYSLSNDNDVPVIDCADILELGATAKAWRYKRQFQKAADMQLLYEQGIMQLLWDKENQPNETHLINVRPYDRNSG